MQEDVIQILYSKSNNIFWIKRYIKFINACNSESGEKHHICPKADDLFPQYKSFKKYSWNCKILTTRQHYIAHWMLWKIYNGSQSCAFFRMSKGRIRSSRVYQKVREEHSKYVGHINSIKVKQLASEGKMYAQTDEWKNIMSKINQEKIKTNTHHWQTIEHQEKQRELVIERNADNMSKGTHNFQLNNSRENVQELKILSKLYKIKLGCGWIQKSNEWIDNKLSEIKNGND